MPLDEPIKGFSVFQLSLHTAVTISGVHLQRHAITSFHAWNQIPPSHASLVGSNTVLNNIVHAN